MMVLTGVVNQLKTFEKNMTTKARIKETQYY